MDKLFISYSRKDSQFVDALVGELERRGYDVWLDRENILGGAPWREEIVENIRRSDVFLILLSPNSVASPNVTKELALADSYKIRIVPILLAPVEIPAAMEYRVSHLQMIDFSTVPFGVGLERLLRVLPPAPNPVPIQQPDERTARKRGNRLWWMGLGGVGVLGVAALICVAALFLFNQFPSTPSVTAAPLGPIQTEAAILETSEPLSQNDPDQLMAFATEFLGQAVNAEIATYRNNDPSYVSAYFTGEPLDNILLELEALANQGLVRESVFDFNLSYVDGVREINSNTIEVDTCEYWALNLYSILDGSLVGSEPVKLIPQTIVIERFSSGWFITQVFFYDPPSFCN